MAAVLAESMVGGIRFHPDVIQSEAPEFRSSTTLAHSPCLRHATGVVYLDNAFVLIEGHPPRSTSGALPNVACWRWPKSWCHQWLHCRASLIPPSRTIAMPAETDPPALPGVPGESWQSYRDRDV